MLSCPLGFECARRIGVGHGHVCTSDWCHKWGGMRVLLGAEIQGLPRRVWVGSSLLLLLSERLTVQLFGLRSRDVSLVAETH